MLQVARGLVAAHAAKVVHRDLQPKNILFDTERRAKIVDFGLARLNDTQINTETAGAGTRPYKSPEQFAAQKDVDHRSDIYSFGVVLFELLTGELPFSGTDLESRVANPDVAAPTARQIDSIVDRDLETICEKCLEKDPERRFQSANEIVDELKRYLKGIPILTRPLSRWERLHRIYIRPHRTIIALSAALLISVAIALTYQQLFRDSELNREQIVEENDQVRQENKDLKTETNQARTNLAATTQQLDSSRKVIEEQQETVVQEQALRSQAEERKELIAYADDLQRIQSAWNESDPVQVSQLLARHDPERNGGTRDLRGFEWHYWKHLISDSRHVLQNGGTCRCLAVDPAGEFLAATDFQNVTLWKLSDHSKLWKDVLVPQKPQFLSFDTSTSWDGSASFSPDGQYVAATGFQLGNPQRLGFLKVWEVSRGKEVLSIADESSLSGRAVTFSPDSRFVIGGGYQNEWVAWEVRNKRHRIVSQSNSPTRKAVSPPVLGHPSSTTSFDIVSFLGFSDDGTRLFASCMGGANADSWKWSDVEKESGGLRERIDPVDAGIVRVARDGSVTVATISSADQKVHLRHRRPGASRPVIGFNAHASSVAMQDTVLSQPSPATCLDFRNGRLVAGGANRLVYAWVIQDAPVNVWDTEELRGHGSNITCVGQLPNGRPVSADEDGEIRLWLDSEPEAIDLESQSCLQQISEYENHGNREIRIRNLDGTDSVIPLKEGESLSSSLLSDQERFLALATSSHNHAETPPRLILWDRSESQQVFERDLVGGGTGRWAVSRDESTFAACVGQKSVSVWGASSGDEIRSIDVSQYAKLAISHNGKRLAVEGEGGIVVWDVVDGNRLCQIPTVQRSDSWGVGFAFTSDGHKLALNGDPPQFYDVETGQPQEATWEPLAENDLGSVGRRRLYRFTAKGLEICCASTFRPLSTIPLRRRNGGGVPIPLDEVAGANGFCTSGALDRQFKDLVLNWKKMRSE